MIRPPSWCLTTIFLVLFTRILLQAQQNTGEPRRVEGISTDKFMEFAPTISADGNTMIIESNRNSSRIKERWELFESTRNPDGTWREAVPLTAINEKCQFLAGPSLSYDGNRIFFTAFIEGVTTSEDIFYAERLTNTQWGEPKSIGPPINTEGYEGFPSISADGNSLYFIRVNLIEPINKKAKENCFEIYVSHKRPDGEWGEPEKLPDQINMGCVRDPRIMADNHTLIFSAITPNGKGKYDLFQSRINADGTWTDARPLDFINSDENDQSPTISAAGDVIFFYTKNDIYAMPIPLEYRQLINVTVQGFVRSEKDALPVLAVMEVRNLVTGEKVTSSNNPNDGRFSLVLAAGAHFKVEFLNPSYLKEVREFDLRKQDTYKQVDININLKSVYRAALITSDRDLKIPVPAHIRVYDQQGKVILEDSLRGGQPSPVVALETGQQYSFYVTAQDYLDVKQSLAFDAVIFKPDTTLVFQMTHDKVKFSTEVTDVTTNKRVRTKVTFNNTTKDEVIIGESGEAVYLRKGDRYQVVASSDKGYFFATSAIVAGEGEVQPDGSHLLNVLITPIRDGATLTLNNITFETNSSDLKSSSYAELDRVIELMHQNPSVIIEIAAHTDDVGSEDYNHKLSQRRAQSVITYLNKKGIVNKRFEAKGYGKSKPRAPNDSEESRAVNRRVELIILKVG